MSNLFVLEKHFTDLLNQYIGIMDGEMGAGEMLLSMAENLKNPVFMIPVLGLQGVGKSTLLNAVMKDIFLPDNVDETTCVPVEIRYGENPVIQVHFLNEQSMLTLSTNDDINPYVNNQYNPGNEKGVSHVVVFKKDSLLKAGLVLIDLPGVGSLTENNVNTTMRYIEKLYFALFVIPSVPPIRKIEEIFIKSAWSRFSNAWFIQNCWEDETQKEIKEGHEHNINVLKSIARELGTELKHEVLTINAYAAAKGYATGSKELIERSGIQKLMERIVEESENWKESAEIAFNQRIRELADYATERILSEIDTCSMSQKELKDKIALEEEEFKRNTWDIQNKINEIDDLVDEQYMKVKKFAREQAKICEEDIRVDIFHLVDSGVVDGEDLQNAFTEYQTQYTAEALDAYYNLIHDLAEELSKKMEELKDALSKDKGFYTQTSTFYKAKSLKFEKGIDAAFKLGGAAGGIWLGAIVGGSIGGPVGVVVGMAVGFLVGMVGNGLGSLSKKAIHSSRATQTKKQLQPVIEAYTQKLEQSIELGYSSIRSTLKEQLQDHLKERMEWFKRNHDEKVAKLSEDFDKSVELEKLSTDLNYIRKIQKEMDRIE